LHLLLAPSLLPHGLLMGRLRSAARGLHQEGRARVSDGLNERLVGSPLLYGVNLDLHRLLVDIG
jgi:hypothetical protein